MKLTKKQIKKAGDAVGLVYAALFWQKLIKANTEKKPKPRKKKGIDV